MSLFDLIAQLTCHYFMQRCCKQLDLRVISIVALRVYSLQKDVCLLLMEKQSLSRPILLNKTDSKENAWFPRPSKCIELTFTRFLSSSLPPKISGCIHGSVDTTWAFYLCGHKFAPCTAQKLCIGQSAPTKNTMFCYSPFSFSHSRLVLSFCDFFHFCHRYICW